MEFLVNNFQADLGIWRIGYFLRCCSQVIATDLTDDRPHYSWYLTQIYVAICRHLAWMS